MKLSIRENTVLDKYRKHANFFVITKGSYHPNSHNPQLI